MQIRHIAFLLLCCVALSGCFDKEERAQKHYENALALLDEGDTPRAMIELRNVFQNNGFHIEARRLYADQLLEQNDVQGAYSHYLRLIEQNPDIIDVRRLLAEISLDTGNWNEVERHGQAALELAPDDPANQAIGIMLDYHEAKLRNNSVAAAQSVEKARALLDREPELDTALRLMVDWHATGPEPGRALPYIERLLERHPNSQSMMMARLRALDAAGQDEKVGAALRDMYERFPANEEFADLLLQWYLSRNDIAAAEAFLREQAGADNSAPEGHFAVVRLIRETQGVQAALAELDRLSTANDATDTGRRYAAQAALLRFETGADRGTATMQALVENMDDSNLRNDGLYVLSRMHVALNEQEQARTLIASILESDPFHVDALMARGVEHTEDGNPSEAVNDLRKALDQSPRNEQALLLLADAQQRLGNVELAEQRLAQAVEVSNSAPQAAIVFAQFQIRRGNLPAAERVLSNSIAAGITNLEAAALLAQVQLQLGDVEGARDLLAQLIASEIPEATGLIRNLQATILFNENRVEDSLQFLRNSLDEDGDGTDDLGTELQMLRIQMLSGRFDEARDQLDVLRARFPDTTALRVIEGNMLSLEGRLDDAIVLFETLLEEDPDRLIVIQRLYALMRQAGQAEAASDLLVQALNRQPDAAPLVLLRALELERSGSIDAALQSYEALYAENPNNLTVVNNYASMLAYYREDEESLRQASSISAPLNGTNVPAFLDTLGYIKMREGSLGEAILNFEAAARGLADNPTVAFNLATAYEKIGRREDALAELERGFRLAEDNQDVPKLGEARALYATLKD